MLRDGNFVEKQWRKPETPVYAKHYVFDVDNPSEVQNMGAKPSLSQKGPYTYRLVIKSMVYKFPSLVEILVCLAESAFNRF